MTDLFLESIYWGGLSLLREGVVSGMGDGGYIQTSSRRGSFRKESSFKEWEQNTESQSSTSRNYVSQMSYSSGMAPTLAGFGRTGDSSPEAVFGRGGDGVRG